MLLVTVIGFMSDLIEKIRSGIYVYPESPQWNDLWEMLLENLPEVDVPRPLILAASIATDYDKNQRLNEQIDLAESNGLMDQAVKILETVPQERWVLSSGNLDPNEKSWWEIHEEKYSRAEMAWSEVSDPYYRNVKILVSKLIGERLISSVSDLLGIFEEVVPQWFPEFYNEDADDFTYYTLEELNWSKYEKFKDDLMTVYQSHDDLFKASLNFDKSEVATAADWLSDVGSLSDFLEEAMEGDH